MITHPHGLVAPDGGERLEFLGASTMRLLWADPTDGTTFYDYSSEPSVAGSPQHVHHGHDETFYVVRGSFEFTIGDETVTLGEGGFLHVPAGTPHAFRNTGDVPGRLVGTFRPGRFADYFRELAAIIRTSGGPPQPAAWAELYSRYDTTFADDATQH
jgi:mannose-6-phosphate isomerase-like protein (cupin superfamily)